MQVEIPLKLLTLNLQQMGCLAYREQCKIPSQNFQIFLSLKIISNVWGFCFQTVSESDWSKGKLNGCLELGMLMNEQGTEAGMRDQSRSSRHVVDFRIQCQDVPCLYSHGLSTLYITWSGVRIVCSCWVCSQATCGAVCLTTSISRVPVAFWCSHGPSLLCMKRLLES